jgi:hypothetical protein
MSSPNSLQIMAAVRHERLKSFTLLTKLALMP